MTNRMSWIAALCCSFVVGCGDDVECDTTGTYMVDVDWTGEAGPFGPTLGLCGFRDPDEQTLVIAFNPEKDRNDIFFEGMPVSGLTEGCHISFSYDEVDTEDMEMRLYGMNIDRLPDDRVTGTGVMRQDSPGGRCNQTFVVTGRLVGPAAPL